MTFENLPSTNTPLNANNLNAVINLTGFIQMFAGSSAPTGWLICDGSAISRTTYADLYNVIGTIYGTGDGSTTFNIPDLRGRIGVGESSDTEFNTLGKTGGSKTHILTIDEMPSHTHAAINYTMGYTGGSQTGYNTLINGVATSDTGNAVKSTGGGQAHNNLQPYITINYIIKI